MQTLDDGVRKIVSQTAFRAPVLDPGWYPAGEGVPCQAAVASAFCEDVGWNGQHRLQDRLHQERMVHLNHIGLG